MTVATACYSFAERVNKITDAELTNGDLIKQIQDLNNSLNEIKADQELSLQDQLGVNIAQWAIMKRAESLMEGKNLTEVQLFVPQFENALKTLNDSPNYRMLLAKSYPFVKKERMEGVSNTTKSFIDIINNITGLQISLNNDGIIANAQSSDFLKTASSFSTKVKQIRNVGKYIGFQNNIEEKKSIKTEGDIELTEVRKKDNKKFYNGIILPVHIDAKTLSHRIANDQSLYNTLATLIIFSSEKPDYSILKGDSENQNRIITSKSSAIKRMVAYVIRVISIIVGISSSVATYTIANKALAASVALTPLFSAISALVAVGVIGAVALKIRDINLKKRLATIGATTEGSLKRENKVSVSWFAEIFTWIFETISNYGLSIADRIEFGNSIKLVEKIAEKVIKNATNNKIIEKAIKNSKRKVANRDKAAEIQISMIKNAAYEQLRDFYNNTQRDFPVNNDIVGGIKCTSKKQTYSSMVKEKIDQINNVQI